MITDVTWNVQSFLFGVVVLVFFFFFFFFLRRKKPMDTISNGDKVVLLLRGVRIRKLRFPLSQT